MTADLSALIARLEAAEAGSRELDVAIARSLGWGVHNARRFGLWVVPFGEYDTCDPSDMFELGEFTTSLDAALALAERVLGTDQEYEITTLYNIARVTLNMNHGDESGPFYGSNDCCVVPLATCAATLRAKLDGYEAEGEVNKNPKAQEG